MRVLVASDRIGALTSAQAGRVLAEGWPDADVTVLPVGTAGAGAVGAYADLARITVTTWAADEVLLTGGGDGTTAVAGADGPAAGPGIPWSASSAPLGEAAVRLLRAAPRRLVLDLAGLWVHDGGAGLLGALGATADRPLDRGVEGLSGVASVDLAAARTRLAGTELVGLVPDADADRPLLGLRGITSLRGRETELDPARLLGTDATLQRWAELVAPDHGATPGAGACGGLGLAVLALGGRLATGPALAFGSPAGEAARAGADLVVTGCSVLDFAGRGGGVVAEAARVAAGSLAPCIVIAGEVVIGSRELRTMGVEAAYAVRESSLDAPIGDVPEEALRSTVRRVARSWRW